MWTSDACNSTMNFLFPYPNNIMMILLTGFFVHSLFAVFLFCFFSLLSICFSLFTAPFLFYQPPSSPPPQHLSSTCGPAEGKFQGRGNPQGNQALHRWLANYAFITSSFLLFASSGHCFKMTLCSCDTSHLSATGSVAHKSSNQYG